MSILESDRLWASVFFSSLTVFFPCRWSLSSSPPSASPPSSYFSIELHQLFSVAPVLATACVFTPDVEVCCFSNRLFSFSLLPNPILPPLCVVRPSLPPSFVVAHVRIKPLTLFSPVRNQSPSPPAPNPPPPPLALSTVRPQTLRSFFHVLNFAHIFCFVFNFSCVVHACRVALPDVQTP